jgi:hypothetical protein
MRPCARFRRPDATSCSDRGRRLPAMPGDRRHASHLRRSRDVGAPPDRRHGSLHISVLSDLEAVPSPPFLGGEARARSIRGQPITPPGLTRKRRAWAADCGDGLWMAEAWPHFQQPLWEGPPAVSQRGEDASYPVSHFLSSSTIPSPMPVFSCATVQCTEPHSPDATESLHSSGRWQWRPEWIPTGMSRNKRHR